MVIVFVGDNTTSGHSNPRLIKITDSTRSHNHLSGAHIYLPLTNSPLCVYGPVEVVVSVA